MEVIYTTDLSRPGNDVYIYESISLLKQFELYIVLRTWKTVGWAENEEAAVLYTSNSRSSAIQKFKSYDGIVEED
jgi:hypothetical protein